VDRQVGSELVELGGRSCVTVGLRRGGMAVAVGRAGCCAEPLLPGAQRLEGRREGLQGCRIELPERCRQGVPARGRARKVTTTV